MFSFLDTIMRLTTSPSSLFGAVSVDVSWMTDLTNAFDNNIGWIITLLTVGMMTYGIYLGVNIARAENSDKAQEAKKRLVNFLIGVVIGILILWFLRYLMGIIPTWFQDDVRN